MHATPLIPTLGLLPNLNGWEILVLCVLGVLIFGKRLPEVGRSIGKGIVEFKKGLAGIDEEVDRASQNPPQVEARRDPHRIDSPRSDTPTATPESNTHSA